MSDYPSQAVRMEARSNVSVRTKQHFAPTAIQGLEVLSLPVARLDAYVRDLVERNPLLDFDYDHGSLSFEELPDEDGDASADAETAAEGFDTRAVGDRLGCPRVRPGPSARRVLSNGNAAQPCAHAADGRARRRRGSRSA
ncbi:hypothetical protein [Eggerthella lenta]|uniref:hypothetical protein n=1 Tax=Eggerthella lenta TaxID=84112 RepID=UPI001E451B1A|nr:hypothetical protein [Eggerthella lenta]